MQGMASTTAPACDPCMGKATAADRGRRKGPAWGAPCGKKEGKQSFHVGLSRDQGRKESLALQQGRKGAGLRKGRREGQRALGRSTRKEGKANVASKVGAWASAGVTGRGPSSPGLVGLHGNYSVGSCWASVLGLVWCQLGQLAWVSPWAIWAEI